MEGQGDFGDFGDNDPARQQQQHADAIVDQSRDATRRMLSMMQETEDTGAKTMEMLDDQGEQLNRIEDGMDTINKDMKDAEKQLTQLEKCCGCITCPWNKVTPHEDGGAYAQTTYDSNGEVINQEPKSMNKMNSYNATRSATGQTQQIQRIANDDREDEMEQNLGQVSNILGALKGMAIDMGDTIESQNTQIDRINDKAEQNELRVAAANERSEKILNGKKKK